MYCAEALLRGAPEIRVDVIDRLPTPFGLVRSGVAPDHQATKGVARLLDRTLAKSEVAFFGGVELGRHVALAELRDCYDAVVIATGASRDRALEIPGEVLSGVVPSGRFVGWYNHHPDHADIDLRDVRTVVVIGSGNVALDVARILAKRSDEFAGSDLAPEVSATLANASLERIHVIGRSGAANMKFSEAELLEFGELARAYPMLGAGGELTGLDGKVPSALRAIVTAADARKPIEIRFEFGLVPVAFEGMGHLERVRFRAPDGTETIRDADIAVTCIGYEAHGGELALEDGALRNVDGVIDAGLYAVGWAKRGPSGTIPTNRTEAQLVAKTVLAETSASAKPGRMALEALLHDRGVARVDYEGWRRIDTSEIERSDEARARRKWRTHDELRAAATRIAAITS
jgi:NADPH-dependent glutamate synthase beta subunit-like oxidoreductase